MNNDFNRWCLNTSLNLFLDSEETSQLIDETERAIRNLDFSQVAMLIEDARRKYYAAHRNKMNTWAGVQVIS